MNQTKSLKIMVIALLLISVVELFVTKEPMRAIYWMLFAIFLTLWQILHEKNKTK